MEQKDTKPDEFAYDKELAESLVDLDYPRNIRFSPDGKKVVYTAGLQDNARKGKNFVASLWLASAAEAGSARKLTSGTFADTAPAWHPDGNRIFFHSDRSEAGKKYGVWALRLDGGDAEAITPTDAERGIECWQLSPDGRKLAYASADEKTEEQKKEDDPAPDVWGEDWEHARLRIVDLETKESVVLVGGDRHINDLHWSPDAKEIIFRSDNNTEPEEGSITGSTFSTVNVDSGVVRDLCTFKATFFGVKWAPDGKIYFVGMVPLGSTCGNLAVLAVDPKEEAPSVTRVAFGKEDSAMNLVISGGKLLAKRLDHYSTIVSEIGGEDLFNFPEAEFHGWDVFFDKETGSASMATTVSSINSPEEAFVFPANGEAKVQLSNHGKAFNDRSFGVHKILTCQSADGEIEIDALWLTPSAHTNSNGEPTKPLPTIVMIHGGPTDASMPGFDSSGNYWSAYALSQGYGVLLPNYRGSIGRSEAYATYSSKGVGKYDYEDIITLTDYTVKQGFADPARLMVGGWSQGGYLTYLSSVRNGLHGLGWQFQAGIAGAGITDWDSLCVTSRAGAVFQAELAGGSPPWLAERGDTTGRQGSALWEMAHAVSESKRLSKMVIPPLLILHGANDTQCSTSQADGFHRGMRAHGLKCEYVRYPGEPHGLAVRKYLLDALERRMRWAFTYIGPGETVPKQSEEAEW